MTQEAKEAALLQQAWETQLSVNMQLTTLYDFLEENWGNGVSKKDVRRLFNLKPGDEYRFNTWMVKRL